jgi:ankyrin repeat protein
MEMKSIILLLLFCISLLFMATIVEAQTGQRKVNSQDTSSVAFVDPESGTVSQEDAKLLKACSEGSLTGVKNALAPPRGGKPANIEARDPGIGNTPFIWAAFHGYVHIMEYLLHRGADIEAISNDGHKTALLLASYGGHVDAVIFLLRSGAQINAANSRGDTSIAIASYMNHVDVVDVLLKRRANILLATKEHKYTPLHLAAYKGYTDVISYFLNSDDEHVHDIVNAKDKEGNSPMMLASIQGHGEVLRLLLNYESCDQSLLDNLGNSAVILAANRGHLECLEILEEYGLDLDLTNTLGQTALIRTVMKSHVKALKYLLTRGASIDIEDNSGFTALERALYSNLSGPLEILTEYYVVSGKMDEIGIAKKKIEKLREQEEEAKKATEIDPSSFVKIEL